MAGKKPLLKIGGDVTEARQALASLKADAKDFERIRGEARLTIETAAAQTRLDQLNARLKRLAAQEYSPTVALKEGQLIAQIARVEEKLRRLDGKEVTVKVNVKETRAGRATTALAGAGAGIPLVGGAVGGISSLASAAGSGAASLVSSLVPALSSSVAGLIGLGTAAAVAVPLFAALAAGVVLLGGVLVALAASLAAAVAGAAVLATAFGGALLGPITIAIAAIVKLVSIFRAFSAQQKASVTTADAAQAAAVQQAQAQQTLGDAYANLATQTKAARDAQVAATEAVKDDLLARQQASLGIDQAKLNTEKAQQALADFKAPGSPSLNGAAFQKFTDVNVSESALKDALTKAGAAAGATKGDSLQLQQLILDVRAAKLAEKQANDGLHDSNTKLAQDRQTESDFLTKGLAAYPGYVSALHQVRSAQAGIATAAAAAHKAQQAQGKGLETLSPKELGYAKSLRGIAKSFEELFSPAVDKALSGLVAALRILSRIAKDPQIKKALSGIGDALHAAFVRVALFLADPASRKALVDFLNTGKRFIKPLTDLFIALGKLVRDLATNALPSLVKGLDRFAKKVTVFEEKNGGAKKLASTVKGLIGSFANFVKIGEGLSSIILAFFKAGKAEGDKLTGSLGDALVKYGKFLNSRKGQAELKGFFSDLKTIVKDLAKVLDHIVHALGLIPGAVKKAKGNLGAILDFGKGVVGDLFGTPRQKGHASGGLVFGAPSGHDNVLAPLSGGEYIIRRSVVDALGLPLLNAINAGGDPRAALAGGGTVHHHTWHPTFVTPGGGSPDPRVLNAQMSREIARRAG